MVRFVLSFVIVPENIVIVLKSYSLGTSEGSFSSQLDLWIRHCMEPVPLWTKSSSIYKINTMKRFQTTMIKYETAKKKQQN